MNPIKNQILNINIPSELVGSHLIKDKLSREYVPFLWTALRSPSDTTRTKLISQEIQVKVEIKKVNGKESILKKALTINHQNASKQIDILKKETNKK